MAKGKTKQKFRKRGLFTLGLIAVIFIGLFWVSNFVIIRKSGEILNKFIVHGDTVLIDDVDIDSYLSPTRVKFTNIRARGKNSRKENRDVIFIKEGVMEFSFTRLMQNVYRMLTGQKMAKINIIIPRIEFKDCTLYFEADSINNFIIFRPGVNSLQKPDHRPQHVLIQNLILRNTDFHFVSNIPNNLGWNYNTRSIHLHLDTVNLELDIRRNAIDLIVRELKGKSMALSFDSIQILKNTPIELNGSLVLNKMDRSRRARGETGTSITVGNVELNMDNLQLGLDGYYSVENARKKYNLILSSDIRQTEATLPVILKILPEGNASLIRDLDVQGDLFLQARFEKEDSLWEDPHIEIDFFSHNASFNPRIGLVEEGKFIKDLYLTGKFSNGAENSLKTSFIEIDTIDAQLQVPVDFQGSVRFDSIYDPQKIYIRSHLKMDTAKVSDLLSVMDTIPHFKSGGNIELFLRLEGFLKDLNLKNINKVDYHGYLNLEELLFETQLNQYPLRLKGLNGELKLANSNVKIDPSRALSGSINDRDLTLDGIIYDIAQYLVRKRANLSSTLESDLRVEVHDITLVELIDSLRTWVQSRELSLGLDTSRSAKHKGLNLFYDLDNLTRELNLDVIIEGSQLDFSGIMGNDIPDQLIFDHVFMDLGVKDKSLEIKELQLFNNQDSVLAKMYWDGSVDNIMKVQVEINFKTSDLKKLLSRFKVDVDMGEFAEQPIIAEGNLLMDWFIHNRIKGDSVDLSMTFKNLALYRKDGRFRIEDIGLKTRLNQDHLLGVKNTPLYIDSISLAIDGETIWGHLFVQDWDKKTFDLDLETKGFHFATIHKYLLASAGEGELKSALNRITDISGELAFESQVRGSVDTLNVFESLLYSSQEGWIEFGDLGFKYRWKDASRPIHFKNLKGRFAFDSAGVSFDNFNGFLGHSNFDVTGNARDMLPFMFDNQPLRADFVFSSEFLDLTDLLANVVPLEDLPDSNSIKPGEIEHYKGRSIITLLKDAELSSEIDIKQAFVQLPDQMVELDNLYLKAVVDSSLIKIDTLNLDYQTGNLTGSMTADISNSSKIAVNTNLEIESFPTKDLSSIFGTSKEKTEQISLDGFLWAQLSLSDTLSNPEPWTLGENSSGYITGFSMKEVEIQNLSSIQGLEWKELPSRTRMGIKSFFGLNKNNYLIPEPKFIIEEDTIFFSPGHIRFDNLEMQSNKFHMLVNGDYYLEGPQTKIKVIMLRARKEEKAMAKEDFDSLRPKDFSRSSIRPMIKYKNYNYNQLKKLAAEEGVEVSEMDPGRNKTHSKIGYTLGTLPRRFVLVFKKNPNK